MPTKDQMIVEAIRRIDAEQAAEEARNPLAAYSTSQLKAELARRERRRLKFPIGSTDRDNFLKNMFF